jgi:hypothetical protein
VEVADHQCFAVPGERGLSRLQRVQGDARSAKIVSGAQVFTGDTELTVKADKFLVEEVTVAKRRPWRKAMVVIVEDPFQPLGRVGNARVLVML